MSDDLVFSDEQSTSAQGKQLAPWQVLVVDDMLGLFTAFRPEFVKRYAELGLEADRAIAAYASTDGDDGIVSATYADFASIKR